MQFHTVQFAVLMLVVWSAYWLLPRPQLRVGLLALASLVFYGWWDWRFVSLLVLSIVVDHTCGRRIDASELQVVRRRWLGLSLLSNLGILAIFKYYDFFASSVRSALATIGIDVGLPTLGLVLPMGISFYTFQTLSYTIDIYRRQQSPEPSFIRFAAYVSFFPQLVAGPIERARRLLPELDGRRSFRRRQQVEGLQLFASGMFKKIVVADNIGVVVDLLFAAPSSELNPMLVLTAVYGFALQIYADFSGYSDMARGVAKCLGIELMVNFRQPYFACDPRDFWRRWHISLSTWLRDYLYISLGGSRGTALRTQRNLLLTMLLGGLWHGAAWNFVIWGAIHGLWLVVHRGYRALWPTFELPAIVARCATFHMVCLAWLAFRVADLEGLKTMLGPHPAEPTRVIELSYIWLYLGHFALPLILLDILEARMKTTLAESPRRHLAMVMTVMMVALIILEGRFDGGRQFIYFQF